MDFVARKAAHASEHSSTVHQATGMVSVQADRPVALALALLHDYASRTATEVEDVAHEVVTRLLRFDPDGFAGTAA